MITLDTVKRYVRGRSAASKQWVLHKSPSIGQVILLTLILAVVYAAIKPCCPPIEHEFAHDVTFEHEVVRVLAEREEDEVIEDGTLTQEQGYAEDVLWRWDMRPHREVLSGWQQTYASRDHRTEAFFYRIATLEDRTGAHAPGLLVLPRNEVTRRNNSTQIFYAREVDALSRTLSARFDKVFVAEGDTAYLAYYPRESGIGVEVYAVDLRTNSPLWRTTVRTTDTSAELQTRVQLHVARGRLHVMTQEGELRRIDELNAKNGEIISLQEVPREVTMAPPREALFQDRYKHCVFTQVLEARDDRACVTEREQTDKPLQVVRQSHAGETMWRLSLVGDRIIFAPLERLYDDPTSDIILSYDSKAAGSVVTAIDHDSGEVLWTTGIQVTGKERLEHKHVEVDLMRVQGEPTLVVYTEEDEEAYTLYIEPRTGDVRAILRMQR